MNFKLLFLIIFFFGYCIQKSFAQDATILISGNNLTVKEIFEEIEKQTFYTIGYNEPDLDVNRKVELYALKYDLDKLLSAVIKNTRCRYLLRENHILIITENKGRTTQNHNSGIYNGKVVSEDGTEVLPYATVSLQQGDSLIARGITDDKGIYTIRCDGPVSQIKVSYIGYETEMRELDNETSDFEIFHLKEHPVDLKETVISASSRLYNVDRISYLITKRMSEEAANAFELLNKIPEFRIDIADNTVRIGKNETVLLLVNGMQQSQEYIKTISPERVLRMEVIEEPSGRFVSENYSAIVNYVLKDDYTGFDINLRNDLRINPADGNGNDWLMNEQPEINLTYTKKNLSFFAHYSYKESRTNLFHYRIFKNLLETADDSITTPNDLYKNQTNYVAAGLSYHITPKHMISLQGNFASAKESSENNYPFVHYNSAPPYSLMNDSTKSILTDKDYVGSVFYKGYINDKIQLYSDLSYNYYSDSVQNRHNPASYYYQQNRFKETKNQVSFNIEAKWSVLPKHILTGGYSSNWRRYESATSTGSKFIDYKESRNRFFLYLVSNLTEHLQTKIGSGLEYIDTKSLGQGNSQFIIQPHLQINYLPHKDFNLNVSYTTNSDNPTLYQLSLMPISLDTIVNQIGNADLKTSVNHIFSTRLSYKNLLYFKAEFKNSPEGITETMKYIGNGFENELFNTYDNAKLRNFLFQLGYSDSFFRRINLKGSVVYYKDYMKYKDISNNSDGWLANAQIEYFNPIDDWAVLLAYQKNMSKNIIWQGYQMTGYDKWEITARKYLWNKQVALMLSYIPPLDLGVRYKQERKIDSIEYGEKSYFDMKVFRNTLFFRVEIKLNRGNVGQKRSGIYDYDSKDKRRLDYN